MTKKKRRPFKRPRPHRRQVRDWGSLNDFAIKALLTAAAPRWGGAIAPSTLMRAMGMNVPAPLLNPRQTNGRITPMSSRRRNPTQATLGEYASRKAPQGHAPWHESGSFHGPFPGESHVKMGRRARGRGRATVYGPVKSVSAYRARKRPKKTTRRHHKPRRGPQSLAAARRMPKALRAYWVAKLGGRRGKSAKKRARRARGRMPSKRALRRFVGRLPGKAKLIVYPGIRRGQRLPRGRRVKTRTYSNPKRSNPMATYTNPRRRRRRHNPGFAGGAVQTITHAAIPGALGGAAAALIDSTVLAGRPMLLRIGAKIVLAGVGGALLRKNPVRAAALVGSMIGTATYEGTVRTFGGLVAPSRPAGMKELAAMAAEDEASLGLLQEELRGMGLLQEEPQTAGIGDISEEPNLGDEYEGIGEEPNLGDEYTE